MIYYMIAFSRSIMWTKISTTTCDHQKITKLPFTKGHFISDRSRHTFYSRRFAAATGEYRFLDPPLVPIYTEHIIHQLEK